MTVKSSSSLKMAANSFFPLRYTWLSFVLTYMVSAAATVYLASMLLRERPSTDYFRPPPRDCKTLTSPCPQYVWEEGDFDMAVKIMTLVSVILTALSCLLILSRAIGATLKCWDQSGSIGAKIWAAFFYLFYVLGKLVTVMSLSLFMSFDRMTPRSVTTPIEIATGGLLVGILGVETLMSGLIFRSLFASAEAPAGYQLMTEATVSKVISSKAESTV